MYHERLCVADIRQVARQPERIDDLAAHCLIAALDTKAEHAAENALPQRLEGELVRRVRVEADVRHPADLLVALEEACECERVVRVALRAKRERLEALQEEERAEGVERRAQIAQDFEAQLHHERRLPECLGELEPVVPLGWRGEGGEAAGRPVEVTWSVEIDGRPMRDRASVQ